MLRPSIQRFAKWRIYFLALGAMGLFCFQSIRATAEPDARAALAIVRLYDRGGITIAGQALNQKSLQDFYADRNFTLAWDDDREGLGPRAAAIYEILKSADAEGLDPADYHIEQIAALAAATSPQDRIDRDLIISDGLLNYISDIAGGKLAQGQTDERPASGRSVKPLDDLSSAAKLDPIQLSLFLSGLAPATPDYTALKQALPSLRALAENGGWPALPDGGTVRPGAHDPAVPALRQRLIAEGRIPSGTKPARPAEDDLYDPLLSGAVALFQKQHGLKPDGVIGKDTRAALDMSAEARLHQAIVNLERARWTDIPQNGRMVEVNLAAYGLKVYEDGKPVMTMPVVVGTRENPTPILSTQITTVVLNPYWTLPPNVIKEILPRMRENADYLAERGIAREVSDGHTRLVQPPGPTNPLGRYKFVMPNDMDIYLHDSPDAAKFRFAARSYSHGCVRLGNPSGLAAFLLDDRTALFPNGLQNGLDELLQDGATHRVALSKSVPVSLVYRTAWLDADGELVLGLDIYNRDPKLWKALHRPRGGAVRKIAERNLRRSVL